MLLFMPQDGCRMQNVKWATNIWAWGRKTIILRWFLCHFLKFLLKLIINSSAWSLDPLPGLLLVWGAGRHRGLAVSGPSHPPPHTWAKPLLWLAGDTSARMTSDLISVQPVHTVLPTIDCCNTFQTSAPKILEPFSFQPLYTQLMA